MQRSATRDLIVGIFVLAGLLGIAYLSIELGGLAYRGPGGLTLRGYFDQIGGLSERAPVVISGVKVGQVSRIRLDGELRAEVTLEVDAGLELPTDTVAAIRTAGLLGDQFVALEPGADDELLASGDVFQYTESAVDIYALVKRMVHGVDLGEEE